MFEGIRKFFGKELQIEVKLIDEPIQNDRERLFTEMIINLLEKSPEDFSSMWFNGKSIDESVRYKDGDIFVTIDGVIIKPIKVYPTNEQKDILKNLIRNIVVRDTIEILKRYDIQ